MAFVRSCPYPAGVGLDFPAFVSAVEAEAQRPGLDAGSAALYRSPISPGQRGSLHGPWIKKER